MNRSKSMLFRLLILVVGFALLSFFFKRLISESSKLTGNFDLECKWSKSFDDQVVDISAIDSASLALIRTKSKLYAVDIETGQEMWRVGISLQVYPSPALAQNGIVFLADGKTLYSLDQNNGQVVWKQALPDSGGWIVDASRNVVLVNESSVDIRSYDTKTGLFLWGIPVGRGPVRAYIDDSIVYLPDHGIRGIDLATGSILWSEGTETVGQSDYHNGVIYYVTGNDVVAFDARNKIELWRMKFNFSDIGFPSLKVADPFLFIFDGDGVDLVDTRTGTLIWQTSVSQPASLAVIDNSVYILEGISRVIHAVDFMTGEKMGTLRISGQQFFFTDNQEMAAANGILLIADGRKVFGYGEPK